MYIFSVTREVQKCNAKFELDKPINTPFRFQVGHQAQRTWQSNTASSHCAMGVISCHVEVVLACPCSLQNTFLDYCNLQHLTDLSKNRNSFTGASFCVKTSTSFTLRTGQIVSKCRVWIGKDFLFSFILMFLWGGCSGSGYTLMKNTVYPIIFIQSFIYLLLDVFSPPIRFCN